ncbi:MAG: hypothetical protein JXR07_02290 [Reichenbachiella sp.]
MIRKIIVSVVVLLTSFDLISQEVYSGKLIDQQTKSPIAFAHIFSPELGIGTTSNSLGGWSIEVPDSILKFKLVLSHTSYKSRVISFESRIANGEVYELEPAIVRLAEISITPIDPLEIIKKAIANSEINYPTREVTLKGFQREVIKSQNEVVQVLEAEYESYYDDKELKNNLIKGLYAENKEFRNGDKLWSNKTGGFYVFGLTALGNSQRPFHDNMLGIGTLDIERVIKYYDFEYEGNIELESGEAYILKFNQKAGVKKGLIQGTIFIDADTYAIVELEYRLSDQGKKHLKTNKRWNGQVVSTAPFVKKVKITDELRKVTYKKHLGKWYLSSIVHDIDFTATVKLPLKTIAKSSVLTQHTEQVIYKIENCTCPNHKNSLPTDMYHFQVYLKNQCENYEATNWQSSQKIKGDMDYSKLITKLKKQNRKIK